METVPRSVTLEGESVDDLADDRAAGLMATSLV